MTGPPRGGIGIVVSRRLERWPKPRPRNLRSLLYPIDPHSWRLVYVSLQVPHTDNSLFMPTIPAGILPDTHGQIRSYGRYIFCQ